MNNSNYLTPQYNTTSTAEGYNVSISTSNCLPYNYWQGYYYPYISYIPMQPTQEQWNKLLELVDKAAKYDQMKESKSKSKWIKSIEKRLEALEEKE